MKRELRIFFTALMFYTRVPCPAWVDHSDEYINLSTRYFPLIGWMAGALLVGVFTIFHFIFPIEISLLLSMLAGVLFTGAFHEDGFADVCDGFGGGWTKEKILLIMKDSRVGTYGVVGLILIFLLKFYTLFQLSSASLLLFSLICVSAHACSRLSAVLIIATSPYAREDAQSKAKPVAKKMKTTTLAIALLLGIIPCIALCFQHPFFALAIIPTVITTYYLKTYFEKWIGGYTGDCLGATQQVNEVLFYLSCLAVCSFI